VNWTARPDVFPHGLEYVYAQTGWMVQGHSRYWSNATTYAKQNGGSYEFAFDNASGYALPMEQSFWDDLLSTARRWGLVVYEQDWLDNEFDNFAPLTQSATLGTQWLTQMGAAAEAAQLAIQYCMSHSRHILASVEIPAVTQARASDDYQPGGDQWHQLGTSAMFAYALGIAPSKDNYWSTSVQPGNPYGNGTEPHNRLQAAVLTITKGPVCPADAVGRSDKKLIMRSAAADGTLLQPGTPAMQLDQQMMANAMRTQPATDGELWAATTMLSGRRFIVLFGARLDAKTTVTPAALGYEDGLPAFSGLAAVEANTTSVIREVDASLPLELSPCADLDFQLWNLSPRERNGWALLGEVSYKWVGVSTARFSALTTGPGSHVDLETGHEADISVDLRGKPGEGVVVSFAPPVDYGGSPLATLSVTCTIGPAGKAWAAAARTGRASGFKAFCSA